MTTNRRTSPPRPQALLPAALFPMLGIAALVVGCGRADTDQDLPLEPDPGLLRLDLSQKRQTDLIPTEVAGIRAVLPAASEVRAMAFSPDGRRLAVGDDQGGVIWDPESLSPVAEIDDQPTPLSALAFSPDPEGPLASAGYRFEPVSGIVTLWDPEDGEKSGELLAHPAPVLSMAYSPDGRTLVLGSQGEGGVGTVAFVDVESGDAEVAPGTLLATAQRLAVSPDSSLAACGASTSINYQDVGELVLFEIGSKAEHSRPELPIGLFFDLAFTPDGSSLALAYQSRSDEGVVQLIDPRTGEIRETISGIPGEVVALAISADGGTFALGDREGRVHLLDRASGAIRSAPGFHRGQVRMLAFSPDGLTLASTAQDRRVALWDVAALDRLDPGPGGPEAD